MESLGWRPRLRQVPWLSVPGVAWIQHHSPGDAELSPSEEEELIAEFIYGSADKESKVLCEGAGG